ncbi:OmpA family protein [Marinicella meishanensis]|uniref:OmpA family protein n=1 Tax=Marinicella meishanensis TaxID=2873263 RepID=UPI001CC166B5|nr:OmpA family protein [Marinicella sp. NBU2979]
MNHTHMKQLLILILVSLVAGCASTPDPDPRVMQLDNRLSDLMSNNDLASRGGEELARAQRALNTVKTQGPDMDDEDLDYSIYATGRLLDLARYAAETRWYEDRREQLVDQQSQLILQARTLEAEQAEQRAAAAKAIAEAAELQRQMALQEAEAAKLVRDEALQAAAFAEEQRELAMLAKTEAERLQLAAEAAADSAMSEAEKAKIVAAAEAAKAEAAIAEANAAKAAMQQLEAELSDLKAKQTERGLVITLGDVLFEFNQSDLKAGATRNLEPLVKALHEDLAQAVVIEGHTDNIGSEDYNVRLSEQRAASVKTYLTDAGIDGDRITTQGLGFTYPVASNDTSEGRQQNRRVEIILPQDE